jgi:hypothetical protein
MGVSAEEAEKLAKKSVLVAQGIKGIADKIEDYNILTKKSS